MVSGFCFESEWLHSLSGLCYGSESETADAFVRLVKKWNLVRLKFSDLADFVILTFLSYFVLVKKYLTCFFSWNMLTLAIYLFSDTPTGVVLWYLFRFRNYRQIVHQSRKSDWFCGSYGFDVFFLPLNAYRSIWPFISSYLESSKSDNSD